MDDLRARQEKSPRPETGFELIPCSPTILIIGTDRSLLGICQVWLTALGYQAIVAASLRGAVAGALHHHPDVILSTNLMRYEGVLSALIERLSNLPRAKRVPLIISSGLSLDADRLREWVPGYKPGYDSFLMKPAPPLEILRHIQEAVRKSAPNS